jgi:ankyrin repeat protein
MACREYILPLLFSSVHICQCRFRWALVYLRRCIPGRIRCALNELPETLDETYARSLKEIDKQNWEYAHRLFQCVAAASRPLRIEELAEFLAFDFKTGSTPAFLVDWRPQDPAYTVLSTCSSLLVVVDVDAPVVQFAHFSVKEYLTSTRLAGEKGDISRFHISMTPAHTVVAQACLGVLLHLDENVTKDDLEDFPLAEYAAESWVGHARFENVSSSVQEAMKRLFDPRKRHLSIWVWIYDPEDPQDRSKRSERPSQARATPLHYAAFCGMHEVAAFLIGGHSQDLNARSFNKKETSLHVASRHGHADVARLLLEYGADAEVEDDIKCTPLLLASRHEYVEVVRVLLKYGADTEARDSSVSTPLLLASGRGYAEVTRALLEHRADSEARDGNGWSPLEGASAEGYVGVVRVLLEHGANVKARDKDTVTPLHIASSHGQLPVVRVLLEHGADVKAHNKDNQTSLHWARGEEVTRFLLEQGANANALDIKGRTPLRLASEQGHVGVARVFLEHGADVKTQDMDMVTPLHVASSRGQLTAAVARVLLEHGADAKAQNKNKQTPLHLARGEEVAQFLLRYGAHANALDIKGRTPLHVASEHECLSVVRVLLEHGVDVNARDARGATPLGLARGSGSQQPEHSDIIRLLRQYGAMRARERASATSHNFTAFPRSLHHRPWLPVFARPSPRPPAQDDRE